MNALLRRSLPCLAIALLAGASAHASIARAVGFQEKVDASDAIVLGKVVSSESSWDPTGRWIVTRSTLQVERALKGTPATQLTIVTPGGSADGIRQETIGVPSLRPGDEHVVFVRSAPSGPTVAFFDQGVFNVTRDARGRAIVEPVATELVLIDSATGRAAAADSSPLTLDDFERKVASAIREGDKRRHAMDAGAPAQAREQDQLARFARENRLLILLGGLALLVAAGVILYKRG